MARQVEVEIEIDIKTGAVTSDTLNFVGKECEAVHDTLQRALNGQVLEKVNKPEKEQKVVQVQINRQQVKH
jgi:hypothetical protein